MPIDLIVGDLHLDDNPVNSYRHKFQKWLLEEVRDIRPDRIILVGDITTAKDRHPAWLVNKIVGYFDQLAQEADVIALMGNHDYLEEDHPFFQFLSYIEGIRWVDRPSLLKGWLFLPHTRNYREDWAGIKFEDADLIITHNTFAGAQNGFGRRLRGIPMEAIPEKIQVIAGDVHVPQEMGNILYIGAPYTVNFGDSYDPRMLLVKHKDGEVRSIESIACDGPQKKVLEISAKQLKKGFHVASEYDDILSPKDIIEVRVHLQQEHVARWQEMRKYLRTSLEKVFTVASIKPILDQRIGKQKKMDYARRSDKELIGVYASSRKLDEETIKAGIKLMEPVK